MSEPSDGAGADGPEPDEASPASYPPEPGDAPALPVTADAGATRALAKLLTLSPFLDLHDRAGHGVDHHLRSQLCFALDLVLRLVVVVVLLAILIAIAWKTLAPLPKL